MRRTTTIVCLVGFPNGMAAGLARAGSNVVYENAPELPDDPVARHEAAWSVLTGARRHNTVYTLIDLDPIEPVVGAWEARLRGEWHDLETAIGLVPDEPLPEYYLVATDLAGDAVHWYLDNCHRLADRRIVPLEPTIDEVFRGLGHLPTGYELPNARVLASEARTYVPAPTTTFSAATAKPRPPGEAGEPTTSMACEQFVPRPEPRRLT